MRARSRAVNVSMSVLSLLPVACEKCEIEREVKITRCELNVFFS